MKKLAALLNVTDAENLLDHQQILSDPDAISRELDQLSEEDRTAILAHLQLLQDNLTDFIEEQAEALAEYRHSLTTLTKMTSANASYRQSASLVKKKYQA